MNSNKKPIRIVVLSGKGGTGKTTVSNILIEKLEAKVFIDCDVDAPNLHLVQKMNVTPIRHRYVGLPKYQIDQEKCTKCGTCYSLCAYGAIKKFPDKNVFLIDKNRCESCSLCLIKCPSHAIHEIEAIDGQTLVYRQDNKMFGTAKINIGSGNSGKLVSEIKKQIEKEDLNSKFEIIDGPPGIGCPVISSLTNTDYALIVTEPSHSGLSDLKRIIKTAKLLKTTPLIIVNKADLNSKLSEAIEQYLKSNDIIYLGRLPYDKNIIKKNNLDKYDENSIFFQSMDFIINDLLDLIKKERKI